MKKGNLNPEISQTLDRNCPCLLQIVRVLNKISHLCSNREPFTMLTKLFKGFNRSQLLNRHRISLIVRFKNLLKVHLNNRKGR
jgi:hypothetical protein